MEVAAFMHFNRHLASPVIEFDQKVNFESKKEDNYLMVEAHNIFMDIECIRKVRINIGLGTSGKLILKIHNLEVEIDHLLESISNSIICLILLHLVFQIGHLVKGLWLYLNFMWKVQLYHF
jgi:hypothetical protein